MESDDQPIVVGWDMGGADWSVLGVLALTAALAPVELVSEGERQAERERDIVLRSLRSGITPAGERRLGQVVALDGHATKLHDENERLCARNRLLEATAEVRHRVLLRAMEREAALMVENAELRSLVAEFTELLGSIMDNQPTPSAARVSAHNPYSVPLRDPRRMGP